VLQRQRLKSNNSREGELASAEIETAGRAKSLAGEWIEELGPGASPCRRTKTASGKKNETRPRPGERQREPKIQAAPTRKPTTG
jgi:hypothetical protein